MNESAVKRLAMVLEVHAKIEGMKVANIQHRQTQQLQRELNPMLPPKPLPYGKDEFDALAATLSGLAFAHNDQLGI